MQNAPRKCITIHGRRSAICMVIGTIILICCASCPVVWTQDDPGEPAETRTPQPAPNIAAGGWARSLDGHPRLLGPAAHLRTLAGQKPQAYQEIKSHASRSLLSAGIVHAVEGPGAVDAKPYIAAALRDVARGATNRHQDTWIWLTNVALTYDLLFDDISTADRAKMVAWLNEHLEVFKTDENAFHNSTLSKILCYLRIAYATWHENPQASAFRDYAVTKLYEGKVVPVLKQFGAGGGFTECGWYTRGALWHLVQALELARRIQGYDGFQQVPDFFYQRLAYDLHQPYPGLWKEGYGAERYACEGDGSHVYGGHVEYPRHTRTVLAQYFRGSQLARATANRRRRGSNFEARLVDFLYEEPPDEALDLTGLPLAHLASGIGKLYARSDWSDDATWLRFECGDMYNHHQHFEVGNFEIFHHEPLATESGEYRDYNSSHSVNWLLRTVAHNCLLVHKPDETWDQLRDGGRNKYANDGGQTKKWAWVTDTVEQWNDRREQFERGDIVAYQNTPEYCYVAGDCTAAYIPEKLSLWTRQIVFIRPGAFVVYDHVISTRPEYRKTWLLHCRLGPTITGSRIDIANGPGKLWVQSLLPEAPLVRAIEGYTYGGQTFDVPHSVLSATANRWRVEVEPSEPRAEDHFLHVLSTEGPIEAELIQQGERVGVRVGDATVLFNRDVGGTLQLGDRQYALVRQVLRGEYE